MDIYFESHLEVFHAQSQEEPFDVFDEDDDEEIDKLSNFDLSLSLLFLILIG